MTRWAFIDETNLSLPGVMDPMDRETYVLGGYVLEMTSMGQLRELVNKAKQGLNIGFTERDPIKFNLSDRQIVNFYESRGRASVLDAARANADQLRASVLSQLTCVKARVFACGTCRYSKRAESKDCFAWAFENLIQRIGLWLRDSSYPSGYPSLVVVLDRREWDKIRPVLESYSAGYWEGKTVHGQEYFSGPLRALNLFESVLVGSSLNNPFLQVADLVAGAVRTFLRWAYRDKGSNAAREMFSPLAGILHKDDNGKVEDVGLKIADAPDGIDLDAKIDELLNLVNPQEPPSTIDDDIPF